MKKKRVLITGGSGFLGSHLCEKYLENNWDVIAMDNLLTGNIENIAHLFGRDDFQFIKHDVTEYIHVTGDLDLILHFASPASPIDYLKMPIQTLKVGSLGTHKALGLAKAKGARFLIASTSEVYGDPLEHPQKETYWGNVNCLSPRACYDEGKRCAETLFMDYYREYGVDIRIMRIHNTYGPKMALDDGRVVSNFIVQALENKPLTVYGRGQQTRSFMYIDDLVEAMVKLMNKRNFIGPVNIGNPQEMKVIDLAKKIINLTNSRSQIVYNSLPQDDPQRRRPDIGLAKKVLNWQPQIDLDSGLNQTIEYFRQII